MHGAIKICGINSADARDAACTAGATHLGFNFFPASPRFVAYDVAAELAQAVPPHVTRVALLVDPSADEAAAAANAAGAQCLQLHGRESPAQCRALSDATRLPVIKVLKLAGIADAQAAALYEGAAAMLLCDAAPPAEATRPGGHGAPFDWRMLEALRWSGPWFLAGGLTPGNVAEAIRITKAPGVDVASGVELAPGVKDAQKIAAFVAAAQAAFAAR